MKIYALYDLNLNYYQKPFVADDDKQVLAALAQTINSGETDNAIAQAPSDFELWQIGVLTEDAHLVEERKQIARLNSLIRGSIRSAGIGRSGEMEGPTGQSNRNTGSARENPYQEHPATHKATPAAPRTP